MRELAELPVGARCQIEFAGGKYPSVIRGADPDRFVVLDVPVVKGTPVLAPAHDICIVRFLHLGTVYGFEGQIIKQYTAPLRLLTMAYPLNIESISLRKSERIPTFIPGTIRAGTAQSAGAFVDINDGGGLFIADGSGFASGQESLLSLSLPTGEEIDNFPCTVRSIDAHGSQKKLGLSFDRTDGTAYAAFVDYYRACLTLMG